jgi:hypothetical protein
MTDMTQSLSSDLWDDDLDFSLNTSETLPATVGVYSNGYEESRFLADPQPVNMNSYFPIALNTTPRLGLDLPSSTYNAYYAPPHLSLGTSQPPPMPPSAAIYVHQGSASPEQVVYATPSPIESYQPVDPGKENTENRAGETSGNPKSSIPIVTLNTNNFIGNPTRIPYLAESSRKRPNVQVQETELDSLNAKRLKNREAARRWRQGKKDQISDLQGEVHYLKTKIDAMQTEMETLRIENQYLKQELSNTRQKVSQPPQSPNLHTFRPTSTTNEMNFLPTPSSLFLLCLFVFSLCLYLPTTLQHYPGTDLVLDQSSIHRQPRLLDEKNNNLGQILSIQQSQKHWMLRLINQVYESITQDHQKGSKEIIVPTVGEIKKTISSSLRFL